MSEDRRNQPEDELVADPHATSNRGRKVAKIVGDFRALKDALVLLEGGHVSGTRLVGGTQEDAAKTLQDLDKTAVFHVCSASGEVLSTRPSGQCAANLLRDFAAAHPGALIEVSFEDCEVASAPWMQEFLKAVRELGDRSIYSNLNEDVHATLTFVENTHRAS